MASRATSGLASIEAARRIQAAREAQDKWPYVWAAAPPGSEHVFRFGVLETVNTAAQQSILSYQVPNNRRFVFRGLVLHYSNPSSVWVPGDGNVTFAVTVNKAAGLAPAQGIPFKDYGSISIPLGSFFQGPWPIDPGELSIIDSRNVLRALVTVNNGVIPSGAGSLFTAVFMGWNIAD